MTASLEHFSLTNSLSKAGDLAQLVSAQNKRFLVRLTSGGELHTHRGVLRHDDLIGQAWGSQVTSHLGSNFILLQPSLADLLLLIPRSTQIMYPKDIGYILVTMGIGPGKIILEAGSGSGSLTTALAYAVGAEGHVFSYDSRAEMQRLAIKNIERVGLSDRVTFKIRNIGEGFDEAGVDALFLDVPNPYDYMMQVRQALKPGGFFGSILPTVNQISRLLIAFHRTDFAFVEVCELLLRFYKNAPERLRPTDRMVAHTGFLVFARPVLSPLSDLEIANDEKTGDLEVEEESLDLTENSIMDEIE